MKNLPHISIIIPVLNSQLTLASCLEGILKQDYPKEKVEIIIIDAGSTDDTLAIAAKHGIQLIFPNPLKTGEAGKSVGVQKASGEIIALIDSDNIIEETDWLQRMVEPFEDPGVSGTEPWEYTYRKTDPYITRYCALLGMNDPLCFYLGNYDRISQISGKWTELPVKIEDQGRYLITDFSNMKVYPTMGANGFLIRKDLVLKTHYQPYLFDIDLVSELIPLGYTRYAKVKIGIVHLYAKSLKDFSRKQKRRVKDFLFYKDKKQRYYPWDQIPKTKIIKFVLSTVFIIPLLFDMAKGAYRKPDKAWYFHLPACWTTLVVYGIGRLMAISSRGKGIADRNDWKQ